MGHQHYWDEDSYVRIERATYDPSARALEVGFRDGDVVRVSVWRVLRPDQREPVWDGLRVVDNYYIHVPATPLDVDIPASPSAPSLILSLPHTWRARPKSRRGMWAPVCRRCAKYGALRPSRSPTG